jgi:hypothetical protein
MNSKTGVALSIGAIAAVIVLFATGPLAATQAQAFGGFGGFHRGFGFGGLLRWLLLIKTRALTSRVTNIPSLPFLLLGLDESCSDANMTLRGIDLKPKSTIPQRK